MKRKLTVVFATLLAGLALAAGTTLKLVVNGSPSSLKAIVVDGQTYLPLAALQKAGAASRLEGNTLSLRLPGAAGGANERASVEGCQGEELFNGVWRLRVTKVAPVSVAGLSAWGVTVELKNGTARTLSVFQTGIDAGGKGAFLSLQGGNTLSFTAVTRDVSDFGSKFAFASVPPGGGVVYRMNFYTDAAGMADTPAKFLLEIDTKSPLMSKNIAYTVKEPSFRVRLGCAR